MFNLQADAGALVAPAPLGGGRMRWTVVYDDGSSITEFGSNGEETPWTSLDLARVRKLRLSGNGRKVLVDLTDGRIVVDGVEVPVVFTEGGCEYPFTGAQAKRQPVQYKEAVALLAPGRNNVVGDVLSYNAGWEGQLTFPDLAAAVRVTVGMAADGRALVRVRAVFSRAAQGELVIAGQAVPVQAQANVAGEAAVGVE